ncbi:hypothetical protein I3760_15G099000 [Carya illinoinensis]|nr:hypothetical protein I3760_15G099000 [Carya illinoinensis]
MHLQQLHSNNPLLRPSPSTPPLSLIAVVLPAGDERLKELEFLDWRFERTKITLVGFIGRLCFLLWKTEEILVGRDGMGLCFRWGRVQLLLPCDRNDA